MAVDTKTVPGRRELTFSSLGEVVADAEKLVASPNTKTLGNWPLSQLLTHLATAINGSHRRHFGQSPLAHSARRATAEGTVPQEQDVPWFQTTQRRRGRFLPGRCLTPGSPR